MNLLRHRLRSPGLRRPWRPSAQSSESSALSESLRQALEHVMSTAEYRTIATMWGVEKGMIDKSVINGAIR